MKNEKKRLKMKVFELKLKKLEKELNRTLSLLGSSFR